MNSANETKPTPEDKVETLEGIGPKSAALLEQLGIATIRDLLFHFPRTYQDRRILTPIASAQEGETITIEAEVTGTRLVRLRRNMSIAVATLRDTTGEMRATWFGRGFLAKSLQKGNRGLFTGSVGKYNGLALKNPEYELLSGDAEDRLHTGRIVPLYRLTEKVTQRMLRRWTRAALDAVLEQLEDPLPPALRTRHQFPPVRAAMECLHFPKEMAETASCRERFAYEELLGIQLGVLQQRTQRHHEQKGYQHTLNGPVLASLRNALPYRLTHAQQRAVDAILTDMASPRPMMRLLQGDVGCGKTVVALHAIAAAVDGGYQVALMAPTEVLAEQHGVSLTALLAPLGLPVDVLTGSKRGTAAIRRRIAQGTSPVVVGTHALVQEKTVFHNLGLAIVDEQHRFGVCQRSLLLQKGLDPDLLHMTATPIPRTLALTVYGGMDITLIDELPPGRQPVKTRRIPTAKIPEMYAYLVRQAEAGFQTYYICPLIEESDTRDLKAVTTHFEELSHGPLAGIRTALLHGRMKPEEKEAVMGSFKRGDVDVLFSTTVIEVGIDVAAATTMIIEDAAQFGLTQLHQLRGRVGRGAAESHCFLLGEPKTEDGKQRLDIFCRTTNGFEIAEADLTLRGPGEFYGFRQAGLSDLRVADLLRDVRLLDQARRDAERLLKQDPALGAPEHECLAQSAKRIAQLLA